MRAMPIKVDTGKDGFTQIKASFKKNWIHYLQEAFGLAIFMISACFFSALFGGNDSSFHFNFSNEILGNAVNGILMGSTALFIFYAPFTAPSGSHINPAVTITFLRLNKIGGYDAFFYIIFQFAGGTLAVYIMAALLGSVLTDAPVHYAVTMPGKFGTTAAAITEYIIALIMMAMVLFTSEHRIFKKYTRIIAGFFVCLNVIFAGPVSGFGMNPARSFASAFPAHIYTAFWIYMFVPFAGMLSAAEVFLFVERKRASRKTRITTHKTITLNKKNIIA
jgi:aquaporin Z